MGLFFHRPWECLINLDAPPVRVASDIDGARPSGLEGICQRPSGRSGVGSHSGDGGDGWDLFIIDGGGDETLGQVVAGYYDLVGRPPLPPRYAFGYQQSHRELRRSKVDFRELTAKFFRDTGFPCDLLIYLSSGLAGNSGWNTGMGSFEFNDTVFGDPAADAAALHAAGYRIALHAHHCPSRLHGTVHDSDVDAADQTHTRNYWARHAAVGETAQVDAWWPDGGDDLDIDSRLRRHRMYREGALQQRPDARPFALHRTGYAGMTQWGGVMWSGDVLSRWKTLETQIREGLNVAVSLTPYWCSDVGGFISTREFDGELFVRWFQYATFTPFLRAHGRPSWLHTPHGWSRFRPSAVPPELVHERYFGSHGQPGERVAPDRRVEPICRRFAELRYRLLPYLANAAPAPTTAESR